ncbi:MAG TPA: hypothetical protein VEA16_16420 [Vicinamibacterales bacterium]|nr:hypothetical protein [Vicinamibacterales bacterium]
MLCSRYSLDPRQASLAAACVLMLACRGADAGRRVVPAYDPFTSQLIQLSADLNGDGRTDQWTYMAGSRPLRGESDGDGDGRIDRWEYFDSAATLVSVGSSSLNDGIEDTWTTPPSASGETIVTRARRRDSVVDRREVYLQNALTRVEEDTNGDGKMDQWNMYEGGVLRELRIDSTLSSGRADRRLVYDARGQLVGIERDPDGDGRFEPAPKPAILTPEVRPR